MKAIMSTSHSAVGAARPTATSSVAPAPVPPLAATHRADVTQEASVPRLQAWMRRCYRLCSRRVYVVLWPGRLCLHYLPGSAPFQTVMVGSHSPVKLERGNRRFVVTTVSGETIKLAAESKMVAKQWVTALTTVVPAITSIAHVGSQPTLHFFGGGDDAARRALTERGSAHARKKRSRVHFFGGEDDTYRRPNTDRGPTHAATNAESHNAVSTHRSRARQRPDLPSQSIATGQSDSAATGELPGSKEKEPEQEKESEDEKQEKETEENREGTEESSIYGETDKHGIADEQAEDLVVEAEDGYRTVDSRYSFAAPQGYQFECMLGRGAFGTVACLRDRSGTQRATKKVHGALSSRTHALYALREVQLMRLLRHDNVAQLHDAYIPGDAASDLYLVIGLMEDNLDKVIRGPSELTVAHRRYILRQIARGLAYIHSKSVAHRDLKPSNILVNSDCTVRICDFGMARIIPSGTAASEHGANEEVPTPARRTDSEGGDQRDLTSYVVTRWYRAPEILLSCPDYDLVSDVWSLGCICAELMRRHPLFPGKSTAHQLSIIVDIMGKPTNPRAMFPNADRHAMRLLCSLQHTIAIPLDVVCEPLRQDVTDLPDSAEVHVLGCMLAFNPVERYTVQDVLEHPHFAGSASSASEQLIPAPRSNPLDPHSMLPPVRSLRLSQMLLRREAGLAQMTSASNDMDRFRDWRFVVVDDGWIDRYVMLDQLRQVGVQDSQLVEYDDGRSFLQSLDTCDMRMATTIVFMDLNMPQLSGSAAAVRMLTSCAEAAMVPPLFVAATGDTEVADEEHVFQDLVAKPVGGPKLRNILAAESPLWCASPCPSPSPVDSAGDS